MEAIISSLITGAVTLLGVVLTNRRNTALITYRLEKLEEQVAALTSHGDRLQKLEERAAVIEERIRVANHRILDLENANHKRSDRDDP